MTLLVFDLDQTLIDSNHRTPLKSDGTVDIDKFVSLQTKENIYKDTLLPLAYYMQYCYTMNTYIIICTARKMTKADYDFLRDSRIFFHRIFERGTVDSKIAKLPDAEYKYVCLQEFFTEGFIFYDDNENVIKTFEDIPNVTMIDAKKENIRLPKTLIFHFFKSCVYALSGISSILSTLTVLLNEKERVGHFLGGGIKACLR